MNLSSLKFTTEDFVKGIGFIASIMALYFNLKSDLSELRIVNNADKVIINFRLDELEKAVNKGITNNPAVAILPNSINVPKKDDE